MATIALLVEHDRNRRLLADHLRENHAVADDPLAAVGDGTADCCILDQSALAAHQDHLEASKRDAEPVFLPFLLVTRERDPGGVPQSVWDTVDDVMVDEVITAPVNKGELRGRVRSLLRTRELSTELERQRDRSQARFGALFESAPDPVVVADDDGIQTVNAAFAETFALDREAVVGRSLSDLGFGPEAVLDDLWDDLVEADHDGPETADTVTYERPGGESVVTDLHVDALTVDGEQAGWVGVLRDVTERDRRERELREEQAFTASVIDALPDVLVVVDPDGTVSRWNERFTESLRYDDDAVEGRSYADFVADDDLDDLESAFRSVLDAGETATVEVDVLTADGERVPHEVVGSRLHDADDETIGVVAVARDVSDRRHREAALREQNERLEQFAGVVSHDLRNPLGVARGNLESIDRDAVDGDALEAVADAHERMDDLIDDLLTLATEGVDDDVDRVPLEPLVREAWAAVDTGDAIVDAAGDLGRVAAEEGRVMQLLENLFRNSVEHAGDHPVVRVGRLPDRESGDGGFFVADDGPGIPEADREAVFEHGVTGAEDGTGVGLSVVTTVAEDHGWDWRLTDGRNGGARFEFRW
jgi:PAS domain S-box-containing protein